ncbi:cation:proton antiporter [Nocardia sp. NBC_01503]|uniref:cation:proton antiporter n=1 Tax=Nocardia sp. NBC_01503 TaxID=2975997 RepID=UPI002E7C4F06|nr:cation:proton antiporter [Nocardia sp. NBC_01503]WTL36056.1 cation:proton antiporter [Nocardia sp. NBC_01503]
MVFLLLDLVLITIAARLLGRLAEKTGQPAVIGEIVAGIIAGPTIIGTQVSNAIFPTDVRSYLSAFANVGVMVFMFIAGLEMNRGSLKGSGRSVTVVALSSYLAPFLFGSVAAVTVLARHENGNGLTFAFFIGCSLAITAFPVLARILQSRNMMGTRIGQLGMTSAALDDILAWCVLAVVIGIAQPELDHQFRLFLFIPLVAIVWWIVRPMLTRITDRTDPKATGNLAFIGISGALLLGAATEWIGLHLIFGAFLFGVIFPRKHRESVESGARLLSSIFLPAFFVVAGLQVDLGSLDRAGVQEFLIILVAAIGGKLSGTYISARATGIKSREAAALASLMNTRGLTELIILNIGLTLGLIGPQLYSLLVLMALITTAMTAPLLTLCERAKPSRRTLNSRPHSDRTARDEAEAGTSVGS